MVRVLLSRSEWRTEEDRQPRVSEVNKPPALKLDNRSLPNASQSREVQRDRLILAGRRVQGWALA